MALFPEGTTAATLFKEIEAALPEIAGTDGAQAATVKRYTYLDRKAYGYFGSTTIAYGPETGNGQADLICQYFLQRVLAGASLGRAALEARL